SLRFQELREGGGQLFIWPEAAAEIAVIEQADGELEIAFVQRATFRGRVDGLAHTQSGVPQDTKKLGDAVARGCAGLLIREQQQIDIGEREQLAPAIAANGHGSYRRSGAIESREHKVIDGVAALQGFSGKRILQNWHNVFTCRTGNTG